MKKWFKRRKDKATEPRATGAANAGGAPRRRRDSGGSEYSWEDGDDGDDEPVHDFELAQEDYLVSVALATSANEYHRNGGAAGGGFPLALGAAGALELSRKYWATSRWVLFVCLFFSHVCLHASWRAS